MARKDTIRVPVKIEELKRLGLSGEVKRRASQNFIRKKLGLPPIVRKQSGVEFQARQRLAAKGIQVPEKATKTQLLKLLMKR
jgi:hypothetical protein